MLKLFFFILTLPFFISCNNESGPDVSAIKVNIPMERFDQDFFSLDSNKLESALPLLQKKYPSLFPIFIENILGLGALSQENPAILPGTKRYLAMNSAIFDSVELAFKDVYPIQKELKKAFQHVRFYFPEYPVTKAITLVGPLDAMAELNGEYSPNFIGPDFIGISLQFYLGRNFSAYQNEAFILNVAPQYRSRRFEKEYIVSDIMKLIADDIYPDKSKGKTLIEQIIEKGKQWYLISQFLPAENDSIITGYTKQQLDWCKENEGLIWNYLVTNENLYTIEPVLIQTYIGESPYTQGMPENSPGNIGPWIGLQIIKKFAAKNPSMSIKELLNTNARKIMEDTKYKPK